MRMTGPTEHEPRTRVVLASASPRRVDLLTSLGVVADVVAADIDETRLPGESPDEYVLRVAADKAHAVSHGLDQSTDDIVIISADTSVVLEGRVIGKPSDAAAAEHTLRSLSGRTHQVLSAVVAIDPNGFEHSAVSSTDVTFAEVTDAEIAWYVGTGEPFGKAGAYAIQGIGSFMVESIEGAPSTVIGLPLRPTIDLLRVSGVGFPAGDGS